MFYILDARPARDPFDNRIVRVYICAGESECDFIMREGCLCVRGTGDFEEKSLSCIRRIYRAAMRCCIVVAVRAWGQ